MKISVTPYLDSSSPSRMSSLFQNSMLFPMRGSFSNFTSTTGNPSSDDDEDEDEDDVESLSESYEGQVSGASRVYFISTNDVILLYEEDG